MKKNYTNEWLRAFLAIFFILGIGATFFLFSNELKESAEKAKIITKKSELTGPSKETIAQKSILDSLNILKLEYDVALLEKTSLSEQLELERKNVQNLMEIIKVSKNPSIAQIQIYRKQLLDLKTALAAKIVEIKNLKSQNKSLLTEIESQNVVMYKQKTENDTLLLHQKKLELAIKDAAKLSLSNFKVAAFREKKIRKRT
ncbi:hypothetical protein AAFH68_49020 [Flavobacterium sp. CGRL1]